MAAGIAVNAVLAMEDKAGANKADENIAGFIIADLKIDKNYQPVH